MGVGPISGPRIQNLPPTQEANGPQGAEQLLSKALQGDAKAIEQLAQKLGIDPEQLKKLIQALTGGEQGGKPEGAGGGKPEGAGGGKPAGGPEGAKPEGGAEGANDIGQLLQKLMQAVKELQGGKPAGGEPGKTGHETADTYEAAPGQGPVNLQGGPQGGNPVPPPVEPPSI
jgi:hypothetical protein